MNEQMRLAPPDRTSLASETNELLSLAVAPSGQTAETIAVLAHSPGLVEPFLSWAMALHTAGVLSPRLHEIVALRAAHNCGSVYEWDEHVGWAKQSGLTDAEIEAVANGSSGWAIVEAAVIDAVDELHETQDMTDATLATLRANLGEPSVVEIVVVAGQYTMLSMLATTTGPSSRRPKHRD